VGLGVAAVTEGCVTISPLATTGDFPVDTAANLPQSATWTAMKARNNNAGQIVIGVKADQPGLGMFSATTNSYNGFDILIARLVAAGLGFGADQIQFTTVASQDRETEIENKTVDLVVASYSYTHARAKRVYFAGPYFSTPEAILVAKSNTQITGIDSITPYTQVCEVSNSTSIAGTTLTTPPVVRNTYSECVAAVKDGKAQLVYTDYALLLGYLNQDSSGLRVINTHRGTQYYGIGLPLGDNVLRDAINKILATAVANGTWRAIFNSTLGPEGLEPQLPKVGTFPSS
jgi:glutamate transport system substrate-binding protein